MSNNNKVSTIYCKTHATASHTFWVYLVVPRNLPKALCNSQPAALNSEKMRRN